LAVVKNNISDIIKLMFTKIGITEREEYMRNGSLLGLKGKIKPISFNVDDYDKIFIGGPVWAGKSQQGTGSRI